METHETFKLKRLDDSRRGVAERNTEHTTEIRGAGKQSGDYEHGERVSVDPSVFLNRGHRLVEYLRPLELLGTI